MRTAVLGTGIMGAAIARNLARAGISTTAWNRTRERAEPLAEDGIRIAESAAAAVEDAEVAVTMLPDAAAVRAVVAGEGGALAAMPDGAVWMQTSTVGIAGTEEFIRLAAERGIEFLDAPVLGTKQPAEAGGLIVLVSGSDAGRDRCGPILDAIGSRTVWLGEAGAGTRMKLVVNNWLLALTTGLAETISLAEALGIDPAGFLDVIEGGPVGAPYARIKGEMMAAGEFPPSFPLYLAAKDARLVLKAADEQGLELELTRAVVARFEQAMELEARDEDLAAVYRAVIEARSAKRR